MISKIKDGLAVNLVWQFPLSNEGDYQVKNIPVRSYLHLGLLVCFRKECLSWVKHSTWNGYAHPCEEIIGERGTLNTPTAATTTNVITGPTAT